MDEKTLELVRETLDKAGELGGLTYEAALVRVSVSAWTSVGWTVLLLAMTAIFSTVCYQYCKKHRNNDSSRYGDDYGSIATLAGIAAVCLLLIAATTATSAVYMLFSPEWSAIKMILSSISG